MGQYPIKLTIFACLCLTISSCQKMVREEPKTFAGKIAADSIALWEFLQSDHEEAVALRTGFGEEITKASFRSVRWARGPMGEAVMEGSLPVFRSDPEIGAMGSMLFGSKSSLYINLKEALKDKSVLTYERMLPLPVRMVKDASPEVNSLALLLEGRTLDVVQLRGLEVLTGRTFSRSYKIDDKVYLNTLDDGTLMLRTTKQSTYIPLSGLSQQLQNFNGFELMIDDAISQKPEILKDIVAANIRFTTNISGAISRLNKPSASIPVQPIFITSDDPKKLAKLFGISVEKATALRPVIEGIRANALYRICSKLDDLRQIIDSAKNKGMEPVLIFNDLGDGKVLGSTLEALGVSEAITCNSYLIKNTKLLPQGTSHILFPEVCKSLNDAFLNKQVTCSRFFTYFESDYSKSLQARNAALDKQATYALLRCGGVAGGGTIIYALAGNKNQ